MHGNGCRDLDDGYSGELEQLEKHGGPLNSKEAAVFFVYLLTGGGPRRPAV
jgi:hypothetical protein